MILDIEFIAPSRPSPSPISKYTFEQLWDAEDA